MKSEIPVVFIHQQLSQGNQVFELAVQQALHFNNKVTLISDVDYQINDTNYNLANISDYPSCAISDFKATYEHLSTNNFELELLCFLRWFVLLNYMRWHDLRIVFHCDTDVLLYTNIQDEYYKYTQFDMTLIHRCCGSSSFITLRGLENFCKMMTTLYEDKDCYEFQKMKSMYETRQNFRLNGGVCDMTLLELFHYNTEYGGGPCKIGEMMTVIDGSAYDHNINVDDGVYQFKDGIKHVQIKDGLPYVFNYNLEQDVRFNGLHFQGHHGKQFINRFVSFK